MAVDPDVKRRVGKDRRRPLGPNQLGMRTTSSVATEELVPPEEPKIADAHPAARVVNAAGLGAQALARSIAGMPPAKIPPLHLAKGNYFSLSGRSPFSRLIYPMPTPGGLGVHLTLDLAGQAKFGPDVEWVDAINYDVDPARAASFYAAIRAYWPDLPEGALHSGYAGVRPKIERPGGSTTDFLLQTEQDHGLAGLINLFGIESPGLTASLAIADWVARVV